MAALAVEVMPPADGSPATHACIVLHGLGDSMEGWKPVAPMLSVPGLSFVFVNAPIPYGDGWSWFGLDDRMSVDSGDLHRSRASLAALLTTLPRQLRLPAGRLFLLGFSQGALMVLDACLRAEEAFAGVVPISGFLAEIDSFPAAFGPALSRQRIFMTHGRQDPLIPVAPVRALAKRLVALGVPLQWHEYDKAHSLDPDDELGDIRAFLAAGMATPPRS